MYRLSLSKMRGDGQIELRTQFVQAHATIEAARAMLESLLKNPLVKINPHLTHYCISAVSEQIVEEGRIMSKGSEAGNSPQT